MSDGFTSDVPGRRLKAFVCMMASGLWLAATLGGCRHSDNATSGQVPPVQGTRYHYFKTQFQDETQYIVETIAADVAEQVYYAKNHRLPDASKFSVHAATHAGTRFRHPIYDVIVDYGDGRAPLDTVVEIDGPIWAAECYKGLTSALAGEVGLATPAPAAIKSDTALLQALTDGSAWTIESENQKISAELTAKFTDPALHEAAALLLGAFAVRDCAGAFCDMRAPLCRMTAHLCMSHFLEGGGTPGIDGQVANVMLLTLMNDETQALTAIDGLKNNDAAVQAWLRALRARATMDYREIAGGKAATPIERRAWFLASCVSADPDRAWNGLSAVEKRTPDFVRIGNEFTESVENGHEFLAIALRAELGELGSIYKVSHGQQLTRDQLVPALNEPPERCFLTGSDGAAEVAVIGWGQWANFFQRHLCNAVKQNFDFMEWRWSVPDDAAKFSAGVDTAFGGLRLYPFVRRFDSTETRYYHSAEDDALKVTQETPQLVPAVCWNYLCYKPDFTALYLPVANPHVNEWHRQNPPPGTVYDIYARLDHPSLVNRPDSAQVLAGLHEQAPYDWNLSSFILDRTNHGHPSSDQAEALCRNVLPFNCRAMVAVARTEMGNPARYEQLMAAAATIDPSYYLSLGCYFDARRDTEKAADYFKKASQLADAVTGASCSAWLVHYYLQKGDKTSAQIIANNGAEVYSSAGLRAKAEYLEATGDYDGAVEWYQKILERYTDENGPLMGYYLRYKKRTGDGTYDSQVDDGLAAAFPGGVESASIGDFSGVPRDGVLVAGDSDALEQIGIHAGDVIVAVSGVRVHNFGQYCLAREFPPDETLDLIVWNGAYREIKVSILGHRFGADFRDYIPGR